MSSELIKLIKMRNFSEKKYGAYNGFLSSCYYREQDLYMSFRAKILKRCNAFLSKIKIDCPSAFEYSIQIIGKDREKDEGTLTINNFNEPYKYKKKGNILPESFPTDIYPKNLDFGDRLYEALRSIDESLGGYYKGKINCDDIKHDYVYSYNQVAKLILTECALRDGIKRGNELLTEYYKSLCKEITKKTSMIDLIVTHNSGSNIIAVAPKNCDPRKFWVNERQCLDRYADGDHGRHFNDGFSIYTISPYRHLTDTSYRFVNVDENFEKNFESAIMYCDEYISRNYKINYDRHEEYGIYEYFERKYSK